MLRTIIMLYMYFITFWCSVFIRPYYIGSLFGLISNTILLDV